MNKAMYSLYFLFLHLHTTHLPLCPASLGAYSAYLSGSLSSPSPCLACSRSYSTCSVPSFSRMYIFLSHGSAFWEVCKAPPSLIQCLSLIIPLTFHSLPSSWKDQSNWFAHFQEHLNLCYWGSASPFHRNLSA